MKTSDASNRAVSSRAVNADRVAQAQASMPADDDIHDLADVFHLLGDPNRLRILIALADGPVAVRDLAVIVELSESAVSHALRLLRAHRVVNVQREGRMAYYELADMHVQDLLRLALEHVGHSILLHPAPSAAHTTDGEECERSHGGSENSGRA